MLKNYIKVALRSMMKNKIISAVHITGLVLAIATASLLYLTAMYELSFNDFIPEKDRIGLVYAQSRPEGEVSNDAQASGPFGPALKQELSGIELMSRYYNGGIILRHGEKTLQSNSKFVDADFLPIFSFPVLQGDQNALNDVDHIVLSETMAKSLFDRVDILGEQLEVLIGEQWEEKTVSAVIKQFPLGSSMNFSSLLRFEKKPDYLETKDNWYNQDHWVFVKTKEAINPEQFKHAARSFMHLHFSDAINMLKRDGALADSQGEYLSLSLLPFSKFHLNDLGLGDGASPSFPWILLLISSLIMLIACCNFINLSLASAFARNREIGTRKTLGGSTLQLIKQLWLESFLICLIALLFGLFIAWLCTDQYNAQMNYQLTLSELLKTKNLIGFAAGFLVVSLISGGYPAWRIAKNNIIDSLKGKTEAKSGWFTSSLTVLQFGIATVLIVASLVIALQIHYLSNRPLGFDKSEVISIPIETGIDAEQALARMRGALAQIPWVESVSAADNNMGMGRDGNMRNSVFGFDYKGRQVYTNWLRIDYDYLKTLGIKLLQGRDFQKGRATDSTAVLINPQMAQQLGGVNNIIGKTITVSGRESEIIGIVDEFNFQDLRTRVQPLTLSVDGTIFPVKYIFVRVHSDKLSSSLRQIEEIWKGINPEAKIAASYLDENTQRMYQNEQRFSRIVLTGAIIAIVIACLGLFALTLLVMNRRLKEISIRKVLGASVIEIIFLLSKKFTGLIMLALLLAMPIAFWMMQNWLTGFAYHVELQLWMLALGASLAIIIALITISTQAFRAASANPINNLRNE